MSGVTIHQVASAVRRTKKQRLAKRSKQAQTVWVNHGQTNEHMNVWFRESKLRSCARFVCASPKG